MMLFAILIYAAAMIAANALVLAFGPAVTPINAFFLIGLDLVLRDWLHLRLRAWQMGALIFATGIVTWMLNPAAQNIAIASAIAFVVAATADWLAFKAASGSWARRSMISNLAGAAVDSLIFPTLAFGVLMPAIVLGQFVMKVLGGIVWTLAFQRFMRKSVAA